MSKVQPSPDSEEQVAATRRAAPAKLEVDDFEAQRQKKLIAAALFGKSLAPTKLARYPVIRELGAGGMGVVYLAYDEQLDRRVAIKLLRGSRASALAKTRLQREAQAMARLSHPNVLTVYEVGEFRTEVFVAMEYVKGGDLRAWMEAGPRTWTEVLAMFVPAGEGLAAAHAADIIHRDFKPDNVLVGEDGRPRVADFGLAASGQAREQTEAEERPVSEGRSSSDLLATPLTKTGAIVGTPAYMAPEQFAGARTDAKTDQFSFCVALWEALFGERPFTGETMGELRVSVMSGELTRPESAHTQVPAWLQAVVERGLARDPNLRWPDMNALLRALTNDPDARRRRLLRRTSLALVVLTSLTILAGATIREARFNIRQRYWNGLTHELLQTERERGFAQAHDDASRAKDATRMSVYRSYRSKIGVVDHEDPMVAAALLREVGEAARATEAWISAANLALGRPLSHARLPQLSDTVTALTFAPDEGRIFAAAADGEVWSWTLEGGEARRLYAHEAGVTSLVLGPAGELLSGSEDGRVQLLDGEAPRVVAVHDAGVSMVALGPEGRWLASSARDGSARLSELKSGRSVELRGHTRSVNSIAFAPSGRRVVTSSSDRSARVWSATDGSELGRLLGHEAAMYHARFASEDEIVTASDDGTARAWLHTAASWQPGALYIEHDSPIAALALHGRQVATGAVDGSLRVASLDQPAQVQTLDSHEGGVWSLAFTPDGEQLVSASFDGSARASRVDGRGVAREFHGHEDGLLRLALSRSGRWLATGSFDSDVRLWDLERPLLDRPLRGHTRTIHDLQLDATGQRLLSAADDGSVRIWDPAQGIELQRFEASGPLNVARFDPQAERVAAGDHRGDIWLWRLDDAEPTRVRLDAHTQMVLDLDFSPSGEYLASASADRSAKIWALTNSKAIELRGHEGPVTQIRFMAEGRQVLTASADGTLRAWTASSGQANAVFRGHEGPIRALAPSPTGLQVATASDDHSARLWTLDTPASSIVLRGHAQKVNAVSFDPSGERVVTASADKSAKVWRAEDGTLLTSLEGHREALWGAQFVDANHVLSYADDNSVRLWTLDARGKSQAIVLSGHSRGVVELVLDPGRRWAASASADGALRIWQLTQLSNSTRLLGEGLDAALSHCLSVEQRVRDLGEEPHVARLALETCADAH